MCLYEREARLEVPGLFFKQIHRFESDDARLGLRPNRLYSIFSLIRSQLAPVRQRDRIHARLPRRVHYLHQCVSQ